MLGGVEMRGGVPVLRGIAAAHVSAGHTHAQCHPPVAELQAFLTAVGIRADVANRIEMGAVCGHAIYPGWRGLTVIP